MTDRKLGPPIHRPEGPILDDNPPHIDRYGLAMIEDLGYYVEKDCAESPDIEQIQRMIREILARYEYRPTYQILFI